MRISSAHWCMIADGRVGAQFGNDSRHIIHFQGRLERRRMTLRGQSDLFQQNSCQTGLFYAPPLKPAIFCEERFVAARHEK